MHRYVVSVDGKYPYEFVFLQMQLKECNIVLATN